MVAIPTAVTTVAGMLCPLIPGLCPQSTSCDLSGTSIPLCPDQQTALGLPTTPLTAVGLGFGVQNYTCSADNVFVCVYFERGVLLRLISVRQLYWGCRGGFRHILRGKLQQRTLVHHPQ